MLIDMIQALFSGGAVSLGDIVSQILATVFIIFCILPLHECAHGWVAYRLGDSTAKNSGRLTMNPVASIDPVGSLFLLLFGFGWAKPVPIDSRYFKNPRRDTALTALAGPLANFLAAWVGGVVYFGIFIASRGLMPAFVQTFFWAYITINVALAVFNLIPLPPLDGSKILGAFLPARALYTFYRYQNVIVGVVFFVLFFGFLSGPINFLNKALLSGVLWLSELPFKIFGIV